MRSPFKKRKSRKLAKQSVRRLSGHRLWAEALEDRLVMASGSVFAEFLGRIDDANPIERIPVAIAPEQVGLKSGALIGLHLEARGQSMLDPAVVKIRNQAGHLVNPLFQKADLAGGLGSVAVVGLAAGNYTIELAGDRGTVGSYELNVFLAGDFDGNHRIDKADVTAYRSHYGARAGEARYDLTADVNLDGLISAHDFSLWQRNSALNLPATARQSISNPGREGKSTVSSRTLIRPELLSSFVAKAVETESAPTTTLLAAAGDTPSGTVYDNVTAVLPTTGFNPTASTRFVEGRFAWGQEMMTLSSGPEDNLIVNGGFESAVVNHPEGWDIFEEIPGWTLDASEPSNQTSYPKHFELQRGILGGPYEGAQHLELDADENGPNGSSIPGERGSIFVYQDVATVAGRLYSLSFAFGARSDAPSASDNVLDPQVTNAADGFELLADTLSKPNATGSADWSTHSYTFIATGSTTRIRFNDGASPSSNNTLGTFLDDVVLVAGDDVVLDLHSDSDNSGDLDAVDQLYEETDPGVLVEVFDGGDLFAGPDELAELRIDAAQSLIAAHPEAFQNWTVTLEVLEQSGVIQLWDSPEKTSPIFDQTGSLNPSWYTRSWTIGPGTTIPSTVWIEGISTGAFTLQLSLKAPSGTSVAAPDKNIGTVRKVVDVDYIQVADSDYGELQDNNPDGFGGGYRFFPDAVSWLTNDHARNIVRVRAIVEGAEAGQSVFFRSYDVDDPSTDRTIDPNGDGKQNANDNRGRLTDVNTQDDDASAGLPAPSQEPTAGGYRGQLRPIVANGTPGRWQLPGVAVEAVTRQVGGQIIAEVDLATSFAPGDNFRVGAALSAARLENVPSIETTPLYFSATPQLSVWRRFHVEQDLMAQTNSADKYDGTITSTINAGNSPAFVDIPTNLTLEANELVGGILRHNGQNFVIWVNSGGANASVTILTNAAFQQSDAITVFQDDFSDLGRSSDQPVFERGTINWIGQPAPDGSVAIGIDGTTLTSTDLAGGFAETAVQLMPIISNDGETVVVQPGNTVLNVGAAITIYRPLAAADPLTHTDTTAALHLYNQLQPGANTTSNPFAAAYLEPELHDLDEFDSANEEGGYVDAISHAGLTRTGAVWPWQAIVDAKRGSKNRETDLYWAVYLTTGYEGGINSDSDPKVPNLNPVGGWDAGITHNDDYSILFLETIDDIARDGLFGYPAAEIRARTAAHELGHQFELAHIAGSPSEFHRDDPPNLMSSGSISLTTEDFRLVAEDIAYLRKRHTSPGA